MVVLLVVFLGILPRHSRKLTFGTDVKVVGGVDSMNTSLSRLSVSTDAASVAVSGENIAKLVAGAGTCVSYMYIWQGTLSLTGG